MDLHTENIKSLPIWVQLPELDIRFWGNGSLSKVGSCLGIPLKTDKYTKERIMLKYARLLIDIPLDGPFPDYIDFFDEEEKPIKCTHCKMFGYEDTSCKKKKGVRIEWKPVQRETQGETSGVQAVQSTDQQLTNAVEDFTPVLKRDAAKQPTQYTGQATLEITWHPKMYDLQVLHKTYQIMHCYVIQMSTYKKFYITFVYGMNHDHQRQSM
ncbi:hypothetical protein Cgig2_000539 [Carnegiea gigantea]|uniref:DUF4283 domain-containing protein n=1 Tax=Carnegiea gigantea TaxID=171969 RepID=A0A9Q1GPR2_9CARY|nr:hypothetical protein Cgig2_000539 [Carnegiea gigantea]